MGFANYIGDNSSAIDAGEYERKLRSEDPKFLAEGERVAYAFRGRGGSGRDYYALTTLRLIARDTKGLSGKRVRYLSVPYSSVRSFSVASAGMVDADQELVLHCRGLGRVSYDFDAGVDARAVYRFLSGAILGVEGAVGYEASAPVGGDVPSVGKGGGAGLPSLVLDVLGSDYGRTDEGEVESRLRCVLLEDERVEMAFGCGRDSFVLTSHRLLRVNVQGATGTKVEYLAILWSAIKGYSIETAGGFLDRDSELVLFFDIPDVVTTAEGMPQNALTRMKIDFHKSRVDLFAVQRYISDKLLGPDTVQSVGGGSMSGQEDAGSGFAAWLGDDNRLVDASEANRRFHSEIPILQGCEDIELAFKGRRDMLLFTTKRVIFVDVQGFLGFGKKVEYASMPYTSVSAFSVRTAGNSFDKDSELCLWLDFDDVFYPVRENQEEQEQPPPIPRYSCIEIDFDRNKIDIFMLHRYCSERMMRVDAHMMKPYTDPVSPDLIVPSPPDAGQKLIDWIGDNAAAIDPEAVNEKLHEAGLLQDDESVAFAFKTGRDSLFMTNKRLLVLDVKGISGKRRDYMSIPWDMVRVWAVESAGKFDRDMELKIWFKGFWYNLVDQDLREGKADIFAIERFVSHFKIGNADGKTALANALSFENTPPGAMTNFLNYGDAEMQDPSELTSKFRSSPALLQPDESIEAAFKGGRDFFLVTTKRIITIDKKGMTGKSIRYTSYPLVYNRAFMVETAGSFMDGPEFEVYTDDDDIKKDLAKGQKESLWAIHEVLSKKMLHST